MDLSWRLDYLVATKETGKVGKPVYHVRLLLDEDGEGAAAAGAAAAAAAAAGTPGSSLREVVFVCSPQELEDLQAKLKEAVRAALALVQPARPGGQ